MHEPVADAGHRFDPRGYRTKLRPQPSDVDVHRALLDGQVVKPDPFDQLTPRQYAVAVRDQLLQQQEFAAGQIDRFPVGHHGDTGEVGHQAGAPVDARPARP